MISKSFRFLILPTLGAILVFVTCLGFFYKDNLMSKDGKFNFPYTHYAFPEISNTAMFYTDSFYGYRTTIFSAGLASLAIVYFIVFYLLSKIFDKKFRKAIISLGSFAVFGLFFLAMFPPSPPMHVHTFFAGCYFLGAALLVTFLSSIDYKYNSKAVNALRITAIIIIWSCTIVMALVPAKTYEQALQNNQEMDTFLASQYTQTIKASMEWTSIILCDLMIFSFYPRFKLLKIEINVKNIPFSEKNSQV